MNDDMVPELDDLWLEANEHVNRGKFHEAIEIYKYILVRYSDNNLANEYANAHLGDILLTLGQTDLGLYHIKKALSYDPDNPRYHYLLGFIYDQRYEWENAIQEYRLALDREPWNREYLRALGETIFNSGDKKTGLEYLHKALLLSPDNPGLLIDLATAYMSLGDIESARLYVRKSVAIRPDNIMAWAVLKRSYLLENGTSAGGTN